MIHGQKCKKNTFFFVLVQQENIFIVEKAENISKHNKDNKITCNSTARR